MIPNRPIWPHGLYESKSSAENMVSHGKFECLAWPIVNGELLARDGVAYHIEEQSNISIRKRGNYDVLFELMKAFARIWPSCNICMSEVGGENISEELPFRRCHAQTNLSRSGSFHI